MEMAGPLVGIGVAKSLLLLLTSVGGLFGMPPGERDAAFLQCAPADTAVYIEWAERSAGKPGAPGIDGLAADPEIKEFFEQVERAILDAVETKTAEGGPKKQILGKALPPLVERLLNRSGCLYVNYDKQAAKKALEQGKTFGAVLGLRATLIINGGDEADAIAKDIKQLLELLPAETRTDDIQRQPLPLPLPLPGLTLTLHRHEKYFIVGFGPNTIDVAVSGLSGKSKGLTANKRFQQAIEHVAIERTAGITWIDVKDIVDKIAGAGLGKQADAVKAMVKMVGADVIDSIVSATGVVNGQVRTKMFMTTGGRTDGVLSLAAGRAIKPADLEHVPADADFVTALSLSAPKILAAVRDIIGKADPNSKKAFEQLLDQFEREFGSSIEEDIFQAFGDVWVFHDSPAAGGLFVTSLIGSLEVRDSGKAKAVFAQAMKVLEQVLPGETRAGFRRRGVFLVEGKFLNRTIYFVNIVGDDVPFAPAFCLTEKHLLVAPHPQALKAHLRFLHSREANFASRLKMLAPSSGDDLLSVTYFDTKSLVRYLYAFAPYLGQILFSEMQREGVPLNIFSLPSARAILPYVGDSVSTVVRTKVGILSERQTALPIPGGAGALINLPIMLFGAKVVRIRAMETEALPVRVPAQQRLRAKRARAVVVPAKTRIAHKLKPGKKRGEEREEKGISPIFVPLKDRHSVTGPIQDMKNRPPGRDASSAWHVGRKSRPVQFVNNWTYPLFCSGSLSLWLIGSIARRDSTRRSPCLTP